MVELLRRIEIGPEGPADGSVIWLHGLGASGHDFEDVPALLELPRVRFVFPHAPERPVTINMGLIMPAWFDIRALAREALQDGAGEALDARHVRESAEQVGALIEAERARGVPPERVVLAGFSQGAAIALYAGVRYPEPLAGILMLSGWELLPHTRAAEESDQNRATPLLVCHGRYDPMVPFEGGRRAHAAYDRDGRPAEFHAFPIEHSVSMDELAVVRAWLHARLGPGTRADSALASE